MTFIVASRAFLATRHESLISAKLLSYSKEGNVPVSQELLDILVCPLCKTPVKLTPNQQGLKCSACHRVYPIRNDIPVMLVDEATIDKE